ncbi:hypothetical protein QUF84_07095 [Fictibacillus enclensis]|uniref:Uncharacterized protein n=1 Tax=Fictibacillus enclensis TaxID=1017270 RepID=A0A0V8JAL4_9BACL|nr:hypothetical protein [Fictibacillus enclensis]KSU84210.1 hypothetical protein AS030_01185 [Fictibacillus enclensis]MDM5336980.1 hypothetical protein [Fictibacillus enclensis]WHY73400.1 hypothetical protein QNH15_05650 [Fictibacillus enclensis]SCB75078.1 hypothetical protein GA0061096_0250 [Fictibacillus enclensis]
MLKYKLNVLDVFEVKEHYIEGTKEVHIDTVILNEDGSDFYRGTTAVRFNTHGIYPQLDTLKGIFEDKNSFMDFVSYLRRYIKQQVRYL